jgi:hypothetical protein
MMGSVFSDSASLNLNPQIGFTMAVATARILASGCAAVLVFSSAVGARAEAVLVEKHENLVHERTLATSTNKSPFFTAHPDGTPFDPSDGWAPSDVTQGADPATATSTTPKKLFSFVGDSTAAGNWKDGNGIPAGITLTFDAEFTITAISTLPVDTGVTLMLTTNGASNTNQSGRGIGVTSVPGPTGLDDINNGRGLEFSTVTVSNVNFSGALTDSNYTFTPGNVSNFGVQLFESGQFNETSQGMTLTHSTGTIGFGQALTGSGTTAAFGALKMNLNFGPYDPTPPADPSSAFPRQAGPFTIITTQGSAAMFRDFTLGYDVTYDISPVGISPAGDYNNDGTVDAADYIMWKNVEGTSTDLPNDGTLTGTVGADHYDLWRANFGKPSGSGAGSVAIAGVPEPTTVVMLLIGGVVVALSRRHTMVS